MCVLCVKTKSFHLYVLNFFCWIVAQTEQQQQQQQQEQEQQQQQQSYEETTVNPRSEVWLCIQTAINTTLGYVRLDDHDHDLTLQEIRNLTSNNLNSMVEFQGGWFFASGWPMTLIPMEAESQYLARLFIPSIYVVDVGTAQQLMLQQQSQYVMSGVQGQIAADQSIIHAPQHGTTNMYPQNIQS